ncbi:MAG TPA: M20/M25/M40 family metallo-hydrolase [Thermoplasmata archaeon]|nr:M20/M25/M40 family metallo-hydrolase [Thermoplasmata archaeon]
MNLSDEARSILTEFVRTPSTPDSDMHGILSAAEGRIEALGLRPVRHPDVMAVEAASGRGGVLFNGHLDTVPMASGWTKTHGAWDGDWLYGRGAADMKAGCVAALLAARVLLDRGVPFSLLFTTDEETTMLAAKKLASSGLVRDAAAVVVGEPSSLRVIVSEKGVLWYRATVHGRSAHGSMPHLGDNAVYRMGRVLPHLEPLGRPKSVLDEITVNLGAIRGGSKPNLVADACEADLDCRHPPGTTKADVERVLRAAIAASGESVGLELLHEVPPAAVPREADHVRRLLDIARAEAIGVTYGTEMAFFAAHNPRCVVFGPGETERIHVPDERVSLAEVVRCAEVYAAYAEATAVT